MHRKYWRWAGRLWLAATLALGAGLAHAQEQTVLVPDLTGLNIPRAAAALNRAGLRLGAASAQAWTAASALDPGLIAAQSLPPGSAAQPGAAIGVTVLSADQVRLLYDDNDLTLINLTGAPLDLTRIVFSGTDGTKRFLAWRWRSRLDDGDCTQIWSVRRGSAKSIAGCGSIFWLTTNDASEHFWTQASGAGQFDIVRDGVSLATCDPAPPNSQDAPLTCAFFIIAGAAANPVADYIYFAYTTDRFAAINTTPATWMPLDETPVQIAGLQVRLGDPALFGSPETVADVRRLAPGQCTLLTLAPLAGAAPPEACDLIAQSAVDATQAFWTVPFDILPVTRPGERLTCPAATEGRTTICVMPR